MIPLRNRMMTYVHFRSFKYSRQFSSSHGSFLPNICISYKSTDDQRRPGSTTIQATRFAYRNHPRCVRVSSSQTRRCASEVWDTNRDPGTTMAVEAKDHHSKRATSNFNETSGQTRRILDGMSTRGQQSFAAAAARQGVSVTAPDRSSKCRSLTRPSGSAIAEEGFGRSSPSASKTGRSATAAPESEGKTISFRKALSSIFRPSESSRRDSPTTDNHDRVLYGGEGRSDKSRSGSERQLVPYTSHHRVASPSRPSSRRATSPGRASSSRAASSTRNRTSIRDRRISRPRARSLEAIAEEDGKCTGLHCHDCCHGHGVVIAPRIAPVIAPVVPVVPIVPVVPVVGMVPVRPACYDYDDVLVSGPLRRGMMEYWD